MALPLRTENKIPDETVRTAQAAFPKGNKYMTLRDELGDLYTDAAFADLFSWKGEVAQSPGTLALTCVMQYMEELSDRQAAEAVRARIDWKYALGLPLEDAGFDASVLSTFRKRLLAGGAEERVLDKILTLCNEKGLVRKRGRQRTDATHVLAAVRDLNRLELVGETLRNALNVLAQAVPDWLLAQVEPDWFDLYSDRMEQARFPQKKKEREALRLRMGADGYHLLAALYADEGLRGLGENPAVETLRQVWIQQYYRQDGAVHWRKAGELPPGALFIQTPYDLEVRYSKKRQTAWKGYKVHLTETCEDDLPHLVVNVSTTPAPTSDRRMVAPIHQALADKDLLPAEHLLDGGYLSVDQMIDAQDDHEIEVVGPLPPDTSWQAQEETGFDIPLFAIDWEKETVTCPDGKTSRTWSPSVDADGGETIHVRFARADCQACPVRQQCTRSANGARGLTLRPQLQHTTLQQARQEQQTEAFQQRYNRRAGIEGTVSQGTRSHDLRRTRYIGQAKTHLQHLFTAAAINLTRLANWFADLANNVPLEKRRAPTRTSRFAVLQPT